MIVSALAFDLCANECGQIADKQARTIIALNKSLSKVQVASLNPLLAVD